MASTLPNKLEHISTTVLVNHLISVTEAKVELILDASQFQTTGRSDVLQRHSSVCFRRDCTGQRSCSNCIQTYIAGILKQANTYLHQYLPPGVNDRIMVVLERETETIPAAIGKDHFPENITKLMMKLITSKVVFIDRDYCDKDKQCLIPFCYEDFVEQLLERLCPLPVENLSIYGAMYPSIQEKLFVCAPNLKILILSHINITNDILLTVGKHCENLEILRLQHFMLWMVLSLDSFCEAFFRGASHAQLKQYIKSKTLTDAKLSFPKLRELELSYSNTQFAADYHFLILVFYKNVDLTFSPWRSGYFEDGSYNDFCVRVIQKSISVSGAISMSTLIITAQILHEMSEKHVDRLSFNCPLLKTVKISCSFVGRHGSLKTVGSNLKLLLKWNKNIQSLYVDVGDNFDSAMCIIRPSILLRSNSLTEITIEASYQSSNIQGLVILKLKELLSLCMAIRKLRIKVTSRSCLTIPELSNNKPLAFQRRDTLQELWVHDLSHEYPPDDPTNFTFRLKLLKALTDAAPNLDILSLTVHSAQSNMLDRLEGHCKTLHVIISEGVEWQPSLHQFIRLINNHQRLEHLYLEDVHEDTFAALSQKFAPTRLQLHWGTLDGWPRS